MLSPRSSLCPYRHTTWTNGRSPSYTRGDQEHPEVVITMPRGLRQVKLRCANCGDITGALPRWLIWELADSWPAPTIRHNNLTYPVCSVANCNHEGIERHHFAPRNTFGSECERWPVLPLCPDHHHEWHQRMDGYRWQRKAISA